MFTNLKRLFVAVAILGLGLVVAAPVLADTGPWTWTDLSSQIAERANRPIWAIGRAEPYWYFTDGQSLWNGGHVWKTDGSVLSDVTEQVRDAGIDRVDDIVSDGQMVLFLENVTSKNNTFEIVADNNGTPVNETNVLRPYLDANEGIASITGKNGTWAVVTTEGRVLVGSFGTSFTTVLAANQISAYNGDIAYSTRHASPSDSELYLPIQMVPTSAGWLLEYRDPNLGYTRFFSYSTGSGLTDVTSRFARITYVQAMSSNGTTALVAGGDNSTSYTDHVFTFDGFTATDVTTQAAALPMTSWNRTLIAWNGDSWMITDTNKDLVRFDGTNFQNYGTTADYFVTLSGNSSGSFLIGGADSVAGLTGPSSPLTAKLVKVTENANGTTNNNNGSTSFGGGRTTTSVNGPTITTSGNPSNFYVGNGGTFDYQATATDPNGVSHIDLYSNGGLIKTCYSTTCEFDSQYYTNGLSTRAIPFYAVATDNEGFVTNGSSNQDSLTVDQNSSASANSNLNGSGNSQTQNGISSWTWFDPTQTNIGPSQFVNFFVGANSSVGIRSIQIFVNGVAKQACNLNNATGNQQCSASIYGGDYGLNTTVAANAEITDANGQVAWTSVQNLTVSTNSGSTGTTNNSDVSTWFTLSPTGSTLSRSSSVTLNVSAAATEGLSTINVYANGSIIRTCNFSQAYGTQTCTATVYGSNYGNGTQLTLNSQAMGTDGMTAWSNTQILTVQDNGTGSTTSNATSWVSSSPQTTTLAQGQSVTFTVGASDPQGLQRIDIYANGNIVNTCNFGNSTASVQCSEAINGSSYSVGTNVYVNAKITDESGNVTWSTSQNYTVTSSTGSTQTGTNPNANVSTWVWSSPETSTLAQGSSVVFNIGAAGVVSFVPSGIQRIDIYANGTIVNTCNANGTQTCSATINGSSYPVGTSVFVNAKVTDTYGDEIWSDSRNYTITSNGSTQTTTQTGTNTTAPSTWIWTTPANQTQFTPGSTATFSVGAWSQNGIQKIEVYANGAIVQTCNLGAAYGNQQCSYNVTANTAGTTSVYVNAKVTDTQGNVSWSEAETYTFTGTGSTSTGTGSTGFPTDLPGTIQVSSDHDAGFNPNDVITFTANAQDQNGVSRIDILVNGVLVKTCTTSGTCSYTGGPYNGRTTVSYGAKIVDNDGFALWTGYKTINVK